MKTWILNMFQLLKLLLNFYNPSCIKCMSTSTKYIVKMNKIYSIRNPLHHMHLYISFFLSGHRFVASHLFVSPIFSTLYSISLPYRCYTSWYKLVSQTMIAHHLPFLQSYWIVFSSFQFRISLPLRFSLFLFFFGFFPFCLFISSLICFHPITNSEYKTNANIFL